MSVTNRKMFRRDARDKVRQMGGIMSSSEPLIQEVAKYQLGGNVDILSEIQRMRPDIRSAFIQSLGNPPKRTGARSQTVVSQQDPLFSLGQTKKNILGQEYNIFDPGRTESTNLSRVSGQNFQTQRAFDLTEEELLARQNLNKTIGKAQSLGFLEKPTVSKSEVEDFIRSETGDSTFEASKTLLEKLSGPSMTRYAVIGKEILKYGLLPATATRDITRATLQFLKQTPDSTVEGILAGDVPMPEGVDIIALGANSGLSDERLQELGVPIDQINAMKKVRAEGLGNLERKVSVFDDQAKAADDKRIEDQIEFRKQEDILAGRTDVDPDLARMQEQLRFRDKEGKRAIAGGAPDPAQTTDVKALQDQISGGRISSGTLEDGTKVQTLGVTADQGTEYSHKQATDQFRKDGDITKVKDTVQNTVKSGVGTGGALKQLINEFTSNAPEYEGMDRGLAIAKIGFAMAAGQSPNAITNIANALSQGADMFLKDDEKRRDFKRQVELAGLQYGIGELSKRRAEGRTQARQDRSLKYFVAGEDIEVNGVKYKKDNVVPISEGYIRENGIPSGLTTENLVKGALANKAKIDELLAKAKKEKRMTDKDYRENSKIVAEATLSFEKSRNLTTLLEGQIFNVAGGNVTGVTAFAKDLVNKAANIAKIDLGEKYETLERYDADMRKVANQLIKDLLGEGSKNISNVDRQLASEIVGLFTTGASGILGGYVYRDDDVLLSRLQGIHQTMQNTQRSSLADINDILNLSVGRVFMSDEPVTYSRITDTALSAIEKGRREYDPTTGTIKTTGGTQEGVIRLSDLLTDGLPDEKKISSLFGDL